MASRRKLTSEEVAALVNEADDQNASDMVVNGTGGHHAEVRNFKFGSDDLSLLGDYYGLRLINERFSRMVRVIYQPMLRVQPRVTSMPPKVQTYEEYCQNVETFMSLTTWRIEELRGGVLLVVAPEFISTLTNSYYGGKVQHASKRRTEFTATELRIIEILSDGIAETLEVAWRDLTSITLGQPSREENVQFATFVENTEQVIVCTFHIQLPNMSTEHIDIIYPLQTLKPIATQLRSRVQSDVVEDDLSWRERLERAVMTIPMTLSARIAETKLPMSRLLAASSGDVITMPAGDHLTILIEDEEVFEAELGDVGGVRAVHMTKKL